MDLNEINAVFEKARRDIEGAPLKALAQRLEVPPLSSPEAVVHVDPDLLESQLRIARLMSHGPLTDEPGE